MANEIESERSSIVDSTIREIHEIIDKSRSKVAVQVNQELLAAYWKIGEIIVRYEQNEQIRAAYGEKTLLYLARGLTKELGKGFSRSNIYNMRQFYITYPIFQTVSGKLAWSHYCELLSISDTDRRSFMRKNALVKAGQSES